MGGQRCETDDTGRIVEGDFQPWLDNAGLSQYEILGFRYGLDRSNLIHGHRTGAFAKLVGTQTRGVKDNAISSTYDFHFG